MINLTKKVRGLALADGAVVVGVASASAISGAPKGHQPSDFLPSAKSMISLAMKMDRTIMSNLPKTRKEYRVLYEITNAKLNSMAIRIAQFLEEQGYKAVPIPASRPYNRQDLTGDLSHKHIAVAAGLGKFGINNLVLTPDHGLYVRFATVLTNAPLKPDKPLDKNPCLGDKCMQCVKICPAMALDNPNHNSEEGWQIDKKKCYEYVHVVLDGEICGLCIKACPIGSETGCKPRSKA